MSDLSAFQIANAAVHFSLALVWAIVAHNAWRFLRTQRPHSRAALVLVLGPGHGWLRAALDHIVFRRSRRQREELQAFLHTLSPELGVPEGCRRALPEVADVMRLRGAAMLLRDGEAVVHGAIAFALHWRHQRPRGQDLYYRLKVVPIVLPALRERREDLPLLIEHFLRGAAARFQRQEKRLAPGAYRALLVAEWKGNVRELAHAIEQAFVLASDTGIQLSDFPALATVATRPEGDTADGLPGSFREAKQQVIERFERQFICAALGRHHGQHLESGGGDGHVPPAPANQVAGVRHRCRGVPRRPLARRASDQPAWGRASRTWHMAGGTWSEPLRPPGFSRNRAAL